MGTVFWTLAAFLVALVGFWFTAALLRASFRLQARELTAWLGEERPCPKCQRPKCAPCDPDCEACTGAPTEFPRPQYLK